ncbi:tetratricopeptide repeat protein [Chryseobacterium sp. GP-SGM7]|uniref:tetratricopeptide repeat protein n=1 Tax=Chryseobacterium sp. GP-SGM7 TaxID=3411323 RepID=UPI003B961304
MMINKISLLILLLGISCNSQTSQLQSLLKSNEIVAQLHNDFNNDGTRDDLYVLTLKNAKDIKETSELTQRKVIIVFKNKNNTELSTYESDTVFPCKECSGKSDVNIDNLKFENNLLSYTTCNAPFASDKYSVIDFTLKYSKNTFNLFKYKESYFSVEADDNASILLNAEDVSKIKFSYYDWVADKSWLDYIIISASNITKINDFAFSLESINPSVSINVLQKIIQKYPDRVVAYLNIANSYWITGKKEKAIENYKTYISLMKSQKKDLNKIPKYVTERIK